MSPTDTPGKPVEIFYSYSHRDEGLRKKLETHLTLLKRQGLVIDWHDRKITAGTEWDKEISRHLQSADIILLLISPDFLASAYCYGSEVKIALERHERGEARVIPIILREGDWEEALFGKLQALPKDGKAVTKWHNQDSAFTNIAKGIRQAVKEVRETFRDDEDESVETTQRTIDAIVADANTYYSHIMQNQKLILEDHIVFPEEKDISLDQCHRSLEILTSLAEPIAELLTLTLNLPIEINTPTTTSLQKQHQFIGALYHVNWLIKDLSQLINDFGNKYVPLSRPTGNIINFTAKNAGVKRDMKRKEIQQKFLRLISSLEDIQECFNNIFSNFKSEDQRVNDEKVSLSKLHKALLKILNNYDFELLSAHFMGFESTLVSGSLPHKIDELISYCQRRGKFNELVNRLRQEYPDLTDLL